MTVSDWLMLLSGALCFALLFVPVRRAVGRIGEQAPRK